MSNSIVSIKIQDGCSQQCSYCLVRKLRGSVISVPYETIFHDIKLLTELEKADTVYLCGVNTLEYFDKDIGDLCNLLKQLIKDFPYLFFSLEFINPFFTQKVKNLIDLIKENPKNINNRLCLSIQSASDKILKTMHRPYTKNDLMTIFDYAKINNINLYTEIIVGFPGETDNDFLETYNFIKNYNLDFLACVFSPRPNTEALTLPNQIPDEIINIRMKKYKELKKEMNFN